MNCAVRLIIMGIEEEEVMEMLKISNCFSHVG
jgi:hypothetical protein